MEPSTFISAASSILGKFLGGGGGGGPQTAASGMANDGGWMDGSGWTVATGGGGAHGAIQTAAGVNPLDTMAQTNPALLIAGGIVLLAVLLRHKKK